MTAEKEPTPRIEEYLESIVNMIAEGKSVLAARLAERLGLTPATVSATIQRMARDGLIKTNQDKEIALTEKGSRMALTVLRRHRLAERLLFDVLGIEWHELHEEACLLEHAISARVEERLNQVLKNPACCPHGNPIPGGDTLPPSKGIPLSSVQQGTRVAVERITEEATRDSRLMEYLHSVGVVPGAIFEVKQAYPYAGTLVIDFGGREVTIGLNAADTVWVRPEPQPQ